MPLYSTRCPCCESTGTIFRKIAEMDNLPLCECGEIVQRVLSAPRVQVSFTPYVSPGTGRVVDSREKQRADLKESGCFLYEKGVDKDIARNREHTLEKSFAPVAAAVDKTVSQLVSSGKIASL